MTSPSRRAVIRQMALASAGLAALPGFGWLAAAQEAGRTLITFDPLTPGTHTVASRATDWAGRTQPADLSLKKSNWENHTIWVRTIRV